MADRKVTSISKNGNQDIAALCNSDELWSPKQKDHAILEIEAGLHTYYLLMGGERIDINVVVSPNGKYLRTDPEKTEKNQLLELPLC
jgi:hypothetical protein